MYKIRWKVTVVLIEFSCYRFFFQQIVQKYAFCSDIEAEAVEDSEIDLQTLR